jgi:cytoskeletal protein CcmA (bactofilin family)
MTSSCAILVRGKISGDVAGPALSITNTGVVAGRIKVLALGSEGELSGEIEADEVTLAGKVNDGTVIRAKSLEARLSAEGGMTVSFGNARLEVGDEPSSPT